MLIFLQDQDSQTLEALIRNIDRHTSQRQVCEIWTKLLLHHFPEHTSTNDGSINNSPIGLTGYRLQYFREQAAAGTENPPLYFFIARPPDGMKFLHFCILEPPSPDSGLAYRWDEAENRMARRLARVSGAYTCSHAAIAIGGFVRFYERKYDGSLQLMFCGGRGTLHIQNDRLGIASHFRMIKGLGAEHGRDPGVVV